MTEKGLLASQGQIWIVILKDANGIDGSAPMHSGKDYIGYREESRAISAGLGRKIGQ